MARIQSIKCGLYADERRHYSGWPLPLITTRISRAICGVAVDDGGVQLPSFAPHQVYSLEYRQQIAGLIDAGQVQGVEGHLGSDRGSGDFHFQGMPPIFPVGDVSLLVGKGQRGIFQRGLLLKYRRCFRLVFANDDRYPFFDDACFFPCDSG